MFFIRSLHQPHSRDGEIKAQMLTLRKSDFGAHAPKSYITINKYQINILVEQ